MEILVKDNLGDGKGNNLKGQSNFDNYASRKCNGWGNGGGSAYGVGWGYGNGSGNGHKYCGEQFSFGRANGKGNYDYLKKNTSINIKLF